MILNFVEAYYNAADSNALMLLRAQIEILKKIIPINQSYPIQNHIKASRVSLALMLVASW